MTWLHAFVRRWTFKQKLICFSIFISTVPVMMLGIVSAYMLGNSIQEETDRNHQIILRQVQHQIDNILVSLDLLSLQLANDPVIGRSMERGISMDDLETLESTLDMLAGIRRYRSYHEAVNHISLIYDHYDKVYSSQYGVLPIRDFPFNDLLRKELAHSTGTYVVPPGTYTGQTDYLIMRTVKSNTSVRQIGRLILHVNPSLLLEAFHSADLGNNRHLLVVDAEGRIVMSTNKEEIGSRLSPISDLYHYWQEPLTPHFHKHREEYQLSIQRSSFNQWTYMAITPLKEMTAKSDQMKMMTGITVCAIILLWLLIAFLGSRTLYRPIQSLFLRFSDNLHGKEDLHGLGEFLEQMVHYSLRLEDRWKEQLPLLKKHVLLKLLRGEIEEREAHALAAQYSIHVKGHGFYAVVLEMDHVRLYFQSQDRNRITHAFARWMEEISKEIPNCESVIPLPGQAVLILGAKMVSKETKRQIIQISDMIRSKASQQLSISITAAVSGGVTQLLQISQAYDEAVQLQRQRPLLGHGITLSSETICRKPALQEYAQIFFSRQKAMIASVSDLHIEAALEHFKHMVEEVSHFFMTHESMLGMLVFLLGDIEQALRSKGCELSDDLYMELYSARDVSEATEWFVSKLFPQISRWVQQQAEGKADSQHLFIQQVIEYIHEHFEQDLSLQSIAEHFGCSPYQLSRLFKEYKQVNFVDYLIRYRMERAKEWLVHTDLSIKEITHRLCYTSTQNFTRVFKQITGMPPGNYRQLHRSLEKI